MPIYQAKELSTAVGEIVLTIKIVIMSCQSAKSLSNLKERQAYERQSLTMCHLRISCLS